MLEIYKFFRMNKFNFLITSVSYVFGIIYNRGITLTLHSEGLVYNNQAEQLFINGLINPYPQRILTPLISAVVKINTQQLNLIFIFLFILIFNLYLKDLNKYLRLCLSLGLSTTMPIVFSMNFGGYPDVVSYTFFLLILFFIEKKYLPFILFFVLLLSREAFLVYFPFFVLYKTLKGNKNLLFNISGFFLSTLVYLVYYIFAFELASSSPGEVWDYSFYLSPLESNIFYWITDYKNNYLIGIFSSIKFLILLIFLLFFKIDLKEKFLLILFVMLTFSTSFVCGDLSRCFSPLIFCLILFPRTFKYSVNRHLFLFLLLLNIFSPKYYVWHGGNLNYLNNSRLHFFDILKLFS